MNERPAEQWESERERDRPEAEADIPEHMKPENLEKLRDYGKDSIPPGIA
ncbi:hypothetical protein [Stutzerimonas azotifigens]|nr:hypothetical protein [Stutzerimonas azotifigens]